MLKGSATAYAWLVVLAATGCRSVELDECADPTTNWWPLEVGAFWELEIKEPSRPLRSRYLEVVARDEEIGGLAPAGEIAVKLWREEPDGTGWRWIREDGPRTLWRRDLWLEEPAARTPGAPARSDQYYEPYRLRLDASHLCRNDPWTESYERTTLPLGSEGCSSWNGWEGDPTQCDPGSPVSVTEEWSVEDVERTVQTPAGSFPGCLCVRRVEESSYGRKDTEYCFAPGVGKVSEYDFNDHGTELLVRYAVP